MCSPTDTERHQNNGSHPAAAGGLFLGKSLIDEAYDDEKHRQTNGPEYFDGEPGRERQIHGDPKRHL